MLSALRSWWDRTPGRPLHGIRPRLEWLESRLAPAGADTLATALVPEFDTHFQSHDSRQLATSNDVDLYLVELKAGEEIVADVITPHSGNALLPALRVFDGSGNSLTPLSYRPGLAPELSYVARVDGTYCIGVSSAGNRNYDPHTTGSGSGGTTSGDFTLDLTRLPSAAEVESAGAKGQNDTLQTAEAIRVNTSTSGALPSGDADTFRLTIPEPGWLRVAVDATAGSLLDPRVRLYDASGQLLIQSDDLE